MKINSLPLVAAFLAAAAALALGAEPGGPEELSYTTPQQVTYRVTRDGLTSIRQGNHDLARGEWSAFDAGGWFRQDSNAAKALGETQKSFEKLNERQAVVTHRTGSQTCVFTYDFSGEDATITARVENTSSVHAMEVTGFHGLEFDFARAPQGWMREQHITYFQAHGTKLCHPSQYSPIGGSYAQDGQLGVGVSPWDNALGQTLILWDYTDWNEGKREKLPSRRLIYFAVGEIPPEGARTFRLRLRVSPNIDWHHLLQPYREHFQQTVGPVQYKADFRWIATDYLNESQEAVSPQNPYGFHPDHRRIDTAAGAAKFCEITLPVLRRNQGQGAIVWGQGGDDPRGEMYRPDFDILPPEVETQWGTISKRFREAGEKLGVATRPRDMAVRKDWRHDEIISINPADAGHREMLWRRFENMRRRGCDLFYLDSFGDSWEDFLLMKWLRGKLGPDILTFCEHQSDVIFPFSGGYSETTLQGATPAGFHLWSGEQEWEIYQWLTPGAQMSARLFEIKGKPSAGLGTAAHWFYSHRITPLIPVNDFAQTPEMPALEQQYLSSPQAWKEQR